MDFEAFDAQLLTLADALQGADEATVTAEIERMKALAQQLEDERSRRLALIRAEKLPELVNGPQPGTSPQYLRASALVAQVISGKGAPAERIEQAERAKAEIAALSRQAPPRESLTILRMNSALVRLIDRLRSGA
ncbi:hypothetical protein [Kribbella shirazensis]|uniref:Uncharacterized protein n=1 Tax=Kribbella shirazensis TaxID=1105143 RepID=A0A7X6A094_9ACTN|nr:hypothetical protein [Kribbella shirazensis]NIK56912.1 hypothetical protein [Kribbella shirazensis]